MPSINSLTGDIQILFDLGSASSLTGYGRNLTTTGSGTAGVFAQTLVSSSSSELQFKTLVAAGGINITESASSITISSSTVSPAAGGSTTVIAWLGL
jgi:hypothetical protein